MSNERRKAFFVAEAPWGFSRMQFCEVVAFQPPPMRAARASVCGRVGVCGYV